MSEWKLFEGERAFVSTAEFHEHRERAPHLEQPIHRDRLERARDFVVDAVGRFIEGPVVVTDLGCGDGGMLQLLSYHARIVARGYDFQPSNADGWRERGVHATALDVFGGDSPINPDAYVAEVVVMTEVLEHLTRPHEVVNTLSLHPRVRYVVASSPHTESDVSHDECHAWAWDIDGYRALFEDNGFDVIRHEAVGMFQVILAEVR